MKIYTIGYGGKGAEGFFEGLKGAGVRKIIDVRLWNTSGLAGYTRKGDLGYFVREILGGEYVHEVRLSPTASLLGRYKDGGMAWEEYEREYVGILEEREVEKSILREELDGACLLCAEAGAERCHRRLAAEYLAKRWGGVVIEHL